MHKWKFKDLLSSKYSVSMVATFGINTNFVHYGKTRSLVGHFLSANWYFAGTCVSWDSMKRDKWSITTTWVNQISLYFHNLTILIQDFLKNYQNDRINLREKAVSKNFESKSSNTKVAFRSASLSW